MKRIYFLLIILTACTNIFSQQTAHTFGEEMISQREQQSWVSDYKKTVYSPTNVGIYQLEIPELKPTEYVITHTGYSLSYNEANEQANWVAYELTEEETKSIVKRANKFMIDPKVITGTANDNDYARSGYDKGHLAPAGDMGWSAKTMTESFYYSNMSPQDPGFNRGIWKRIEELVRSWAIQYKSVYVVTGPVLTDGLQTIGPDKVAVPKYFYKVILDYNSSDIKGIGFIVPNKGSKEPIQRYAVRIDDVEKITGIDFFPLLPDEQENAVERKVDLKAWIWNSSSTNFNRNKSNETEKNSAMVQCSGTTKKGNRCKNRTKNLSGR